MRTALGMMLAAALSLSFAAPAIEVPEVADLAFRNGAVYRVDAARSWASAVAVEGDQVVYVGDDAGLEPFVGPGTRVIDLDGRMLLPGFQDSHLHPGTGMRLLQIDLQGVLDANEVIVRIERYAAQRPEYAWIQGSGWEEAAFRPAGLPTRQLLDSAVNDRPAVLRSAGGQAIWVNSRALEAVGITAATADPPNGRIERDERGEPTGVLSGSAIALVLRQLPQPSERVRLDGYRAALRLMGRNGITAMTNASSSAQSEADFSQLAAAGELTVRSTHCQRFRREIDDEEQVGGFLERRARLPSVPGSPRATCIKIFLDGNMRSETAGMLRSYEGQPGDLGEVFVEPDRLARLLTRLDREGFQVLIHAIGDRGVRRALDGFAAARAANGPRGPRHTITHLALIDPADVPRFRQLGVIANMTPHWGKGDGWLETTGTQSVGIERARQMYAYKGLLGSGAHLVWGTDWGVSPIVPMEGIEAAVTRRYLGGRDAAGTVYEPWAPEERVTLGQAIASYTIFSAYLWSQEGTRGSIDVGKLADLVVLESNLFDVPETEIHRVRADMTIFDGRVVFERDEASP